MTSHYSNFPLITVDTLRDAIDGDLSVGDVSLWEAGAGEYLTIQNGEITLLTGDIGNITIDAETLMTINPAFNWSNEDLAPDINSNNGGSLSITAGGTVSLTSGGNIVITAVLLNRIDGTRFNDRLFGTSRADLINGSAGNDTLHGQDGNDVIEGRAGRDRLLGGSGNDELLGGVGNDRLLGGDGDDTLIGEVGRDFLQGGTGRDTFAYNALNEGKDVVLDFEIGIDTFDVSAILSDNRYNSATPFEDYIRIGQTGRRNATVSVLDTERSQPGRAVFRDIALVRNVIATELDASSFVL